MKRIWLYCMTLAVFEVVALLAFPDSAFALFEFGAITTALATIVMKAPLGTTGSMIMRDGSTVAVDNNGLMQVSSQFVSDVINAGGAVATPLAALPISNHGTFANAGTAQTLTAAVLVGAQNVNLVANGGTTVAGTLPLAADVIAALPSMRVDDTYKFRLINSHAGVFTITTNTGWTLAGTMTVAAGAYRDLQIRRTAAGTLTAQNLGGGTL